MFKAIIKTFRRQRTKSGQFSCTRYTGAEGNKGDSVHSIFEIDEATKVTGDVTDNSSTGSDEEDGNYEGWVTIINS